MKIDLKKIPSVTKILNNKSIQSLPLSLGVIKFFISSTLEKIRSNNTTSFCNKITNQDLEIENLSKIIKDYAIQGTSLGKRALNGSGILLHTGLGRSPLSKSCIEALKIASGYNIVQAERNSGGRSLREELIQEIIKNLTHAEATTVVNNNAAATFLMLHSLFCGKEIIISRGQMVEIGGSYRIPEIMDKSGCILKEIGTTNKTHLEDYKKAINEKTAAILFVHQSNFKISGFTSEPTIKELCELGEQYKIPVIADLGSGALVDLKKWGLAHEITVQEVIKAGVLLCCYSGDKLIGGPQAGIISGNLEAIKTIRKNDFSRMFRVCKLTLRALEATLFEFLDENTISNIPIYKFISLSQESLETRGNKILKELSKLKNPIIKQISLIKTKCYLGGGSIPESAIDSVGIEFKFDSGSGVELFSKKLRFSTPAIFSRISNSNLIVDLRGIPEEEDEILTKTLTNQLENINS